MIEPIKKLPYRLNTPWSQCPRCRMVFTCPSNFDRHLKGESGSKVCVHPSEAGLVLNESDGIKRGMWQMPCDEDAKNRRNLHKG